MHLEGSVAPERHTFSIHFLLYRETVSIVLLLQMGLTFLSRLFAYCECGRGHGSISLLRTIRTTRKYVETFGHG